jgi:nucleotide-binding universal stress UspA family protein
VVAGVDGSESSLAALSWAAVETLRGGGRLRLVLAYRNGSGLLATGDAGQINREQADAMVDWSVAQARATAPGVEVTGDAVVGNPTTALLEAASGARMLVVGHRGRGGFASLVLGSVAVGVATQARCPVAVVRAGTGSLTGPVVVGVNGSEISAAALAHAFEHAAGRGCPLLAVHVYAASARDDNLTETLAPWRDKYSQVPVEQTVVPGSPGDVLSRLSRDARLVVVGARGRGGFTGLLLGSTSQQLIHRAACPVLIVRTRQAVL